MNPFEEAIEQALGQLEIRVSNHEAMAIQQAEIELAQHSIELPAQIMLAQNEGQVLLAHFNRGIGLEEFHHSPEPGDLKRERVTGFGEAPIGVVLFLPQGFPEDSRYALFLSGGDQMRHVKGLDGLEVSLDVDSLIAGINSEKILIPPELALEILSEWRTSFRSASALPRAGAIEDTGDDLRVTPACRNREAPDLQSLVAGLYYMQYTTGEEEPSSRMGPALFEMVENHLADEETTDPFEWALKRTQIAAGYAVELAPCVGHMQGTPDGFIFGGQTHGLPFEYVANPYQQMASLACNVASDHDTREWSYTLDEDRRVVLQTARDLSQRLTDNDLSPEGTIFVMELAEHLELASFEDPQLMEFFSELPSLLDNGLRIERVTDLILEALAAGENARDAIGFGASLAVRVYSGMQPWWFKENFDLGEHFEAGATQASESALSFSEADRNLAIEIAVRAGFAFSYTLPVYLETGQLLAEMEGLDRENALGFCTQVVRDYGIGNTSRANNIVQFAQELMEELPPAERAPMLEFLTKVLETSKPSSEMVASLESSDESYFELPGLGEFVATLLTAEGQQESDEELQQAELTVIDLSPRIIAFAVQQLDEQSMLTRVRGRPPVKDTVADAVPISLFDEQAGNFVLPIAGDDSTPNEHRKSGPLTRVMRFYQRLYDELENANAITAVAKAHFGIAGSKLRNPLEPSPEMIKLWKVFLQLDMGNRFTLEEFRQLDPDSLEVQLAKASLRKDAKIGEVLELQLAGCLAEDEVQKFFGWILADEGFSNMQQAAEAVLEAQRPSLLPNFRKEMELGRIALFEHDAKIGHVLGPLLTIRNSIERQVLLQWFVGDDLLARLNNEPESEIEQDWSSIREDLRSRLGPAEKPVSDDEVEQIVNRFMKHNLEALEFVRHQLRMLRLRRVVGTLDILRGVREHAGGADEFREQVRQELLFCQGGNSTQTLPVPAFDKREARSAIRRLQDLRQAGAVDVDEVLERTAACTSLQQVQALGEEWRQVEELELLASVRQHVEAMMSQTGEALNRVYDGRTPINAYKEEMRLNAEALKATLQYFYGDRQISFSEIVDQMLDQEFHVPRYLELLPFMVDFEQHVLPSLLPPDPENPLFRDVNTVNANSVRMMFFILARIAQEGVGEQQSGALLRLEHEHGSESRVDLSGGVHLFREASGSSDASQGDDLTARIHRLYTQLPRNMDQIDRARLLDVPHGTLGGRCHLQVPVNEGQVDYISHYWSQKGKNSPFRTIHAGDSLIFPGFLSRWEAKAFILGTAMEGLMDPSKPELQFGGPGRLNPHLCKILGSVRFTGTLFLPNFKKESFMTNRDNDRLTGARPIAYDAYEAHPTHRNYELPWMTAGNGRIGSDTENVFGRTEALGLWLVHWDPNDDIALGSRTLEEIIEMMDDVDLIYEVGSVLRQGQYGGPLQYLAREFIERHVEILKKYGLLKEDEREERRDIFDVEWVYASEQDAYATDDDINSDFFETAIEACMAKFAQHAGDLQHGRGMVHEVRENVARLAQRVVEVRNRVLVDSDYRVQLEATVMRPERLDELIASIVES